MDTATLWPLLLTLVATALFAGVLAGLLGVGGGIVLVPVLDVALRAGGVTPQWSMHVAVATSLATIIPTAISSSRAHQQRGGIDWELVRAWSPGMIAG
ncbi:MAG: TSUP family transporter, partial [Gammaproteobacteria bacterium]